MQAINLALGACIQSLQARRLDAWRQGQVVQGQLLCCLLAALPGRPQPLLLLRRRRRRLLRPPLLLLLCLLPLDLQQLVHHGLRRGERGGGMEPGVRAWLLALPRCRRRRQGTQPGPALCAVWSWALVLLPLHVPSTCLPHLRLLSKCLLPWHSLLPLSRLLSICLPLIALRRRPLRRCCGCLRCCGCCWGCSGGVRGRSGCGGLRGLRMPAAAAASCLACAAGLPAWPGVQAHA